MYVVSAYAIQTPAAPAAQASRIWYETRDRYRLQSCIASARVSKGYGLYSRFCKSIIQYY